jgi:hypothetical protein
MTDKLPQEPAPGKAEPGQAKLSIRASRCGGWTPADEFQATALAEVRENADHTLNLAPGLSGCLSLFAEKTREGWGTEACSKNKIALDYSHRMG